MQKQTRQKLPTDQNRKIVVSFLIISLFLHFLLALSFTKYGEYFASQWELEQQKPKQPEIQFVDVAEMDRLRGELAEQNNNEKKPAKDAKFLSEKNNTVEKETKAANRGDFQNKKNAQQAKPAAAAQTQQQQQAQQEVKSAEMETFAHGDLQAPAKKPKKAQTISDLRMNAVQEMSNMAASEVSQTNDYLKDVAIGAETHLNAREFLYYTYFNRIKKKLREHWEPLIHTRVRDMARSGRQIASANGPKVTRLVITLDDKGGLSKVQVSTTSGLLDLDDVALEALRVSAPFPNPPKDLIENGYVRINWDFILES